jgi:hypothetical protein
MFNRKKMRFSDLQTDLLPTGFFISNHFQAKISRGPRECYIVTSATESLTSIAQAFNSTAADVCEANSYIFHDCLLYEAASKAACWNGTYRSQALLEPSCPLQKD